MKPTLSILIAIVLLIGCQTRKPQNAKFFDRELTETEKEIITAISSYADSINALPEISPSKIYTQAATLKEKTVEVLPLYRFNMDTFDKDPTPNHIFSSLESIDNYIAFLLHEKDGKTTFLSAIKQNSQWQPQSISNLEGSSKILSPILRDKANTQFIFIQFGGITYISYLHNGKRVYQFPPNPAMSPDQFCQTITYLIKSIKEARNNGEELYL